MKLHVVTCVHCEPEVAAASAVKLIRTNPGLTSAIAEKGTHVLVSHHWPIDTENFHYCILALGAMIQFDVISPEKNLGAHGGQSFGVKYCDVAPDDLLLLYDPDSWVLSKDWVKAMVEVMVADPLCGYISLMDERVINNKAWNYAEIAGHKVATHADL